MEKEITFFDYFVEWIELYKVGAVRDVTLQKYYVATKWIKTIAPDLKLKKLNRKHYQMILNEYAKTHEKQTTLDFHHQLKSVIRDALEDQLLVVDPTRKVVIKGKQARIKKEKYLSQFELQKLLEHLVLEDTITYDWLILLIAKTGIRFSEALALTSSDFDFSNQTISISKTWNYKQKYGGYEATKNRSSTRVVPIDWQLSIQFYQLLKNYVPSELIFVRKRVFNSTVNHFLRRKCLEAKIPEITIHGLRHTHASLLLFANISVASVAKRLGHSDVVTTQKVYLHIIQELENRDHDKIMRYLSSL